MEDRNIDHPDQSILTIYAGREQFSFSIYNPKEAGSYFYRELATDAQTDAFSVFKEMFFEQALLSLPFRKVWIMSRTPDFIFVPDSLYQDRYRNDFMDFLFSDRQGTTLSNSVSAAGITVLYQMPEAVHRFMLRSFVQPEFIHYSTPLITFFLKESKRSDASQMIVNLQRSGLDIFCFSKETFLLGNYFPCKDLPEALYYILFAWKQLQFNQLDDSLHIVGNNVFKEELVKKLALYIQQIHFPAIPPGIQFENVNTDCIPFELTAISSCEL